MKHCFRLVTTAIVTLLLLNSTKVFANTLDHFGFGPINNPQTSSVPFTITIIAEDLTNALVASFTGPVTLSATGSAGAESMTPTTSGSFIGGIWTGTVTIAAIDSNIVLQASDGGGHTGSSNPFTTTSSHVKIVNLQASDIGYDPYSDKIYASVTGGSLSNTVTMIDPETDSIVSSLLVGPGPNRIAVTDNGQYVYVALSTSYGIAQVSIPSLTLASTFLLTEPLPVTDMVSVPGLPGSVVVSTFDDPSLSFLAAIYDNGVARPDTIGGLSGPTVVRFGNTNTVLYGEDNALSSGGFDFYIIDVNASGLTVTNIAHSFIGGWFGGDIEYGGGLIFTSYGQVINPVTPTTVGSIPVSGSVWPDVSDGKVFYLVTSGTNSTLQAYDLNTFALIGSQTVWGTLGSSGHLIWAGTNRLAFANSGNVFIVDTSFVPVGPPADLALTLGSPSLADIGSNLVYSITVTNNGPNPAANIVVLEELPAGTVFVSAVASQGSCTQTSGVVNCSLGSLPNGGSATVTITVQPTQGGTIQAVASVSSGTIDPVLTNNVATNLTTVGFSPPSNTVSILNLTTSDLASDPTTNRLYASIPDGVSGGLSNCVTSIDPTTGLVGQPTFVGEGPNTLAVADNGQYLYVGFTGTNTVARLDLPSMATDLIFPLSDYVEDLKVLPGTPASVAVALESFCCPSYHRAVAIYDNGVPRPITVADSDDPGPSVLTFGGTNTILYGHDNDNTGYGLYTMTVTTSGVSVVSEANGVPGTSCTIAFDSGLIYSSTGAIIQPTNSTQIATIPANGTVLPDVPEGRLFSLNGSTLLAFDPYTLLPIGSMPMSGMSGSGGSLVRWGTDGLAFRTSGGQVFVVRTSLIPSGPPADLSVTSIVSPSPGELGISMTNNLVVTNTGPNDADSVELFDQLPAGAVLNWALLSQGGYAQSNGVVTCTLGTVPSGSSATAAIIFTPLAGSVETNALTNVVVVTSINSDPNYANNSTSVVTTALLDSIGDGIPDWWRLEYFGSGNTTNSLSCASCDADGNGYSNLQKYLAGDNPTNPASYPINWPSLVVTNIVSGLSDPMAVTHAGDGSGRLFVCEQIGRVRIVTTNNVLLSTPFLNISTRVKQSGSEQGLLGLAFSPGYSTNGHFYVDYTDLSNRVVVSRFSVSGNPNVASTNEQQILVVPKTYTTHNGGQLAFGPDGYLYVGIGDDGSLTDPLNNAQTTTNLPGKILRIDPEGTNQSYKIPPTNPFVGNPTNSPEIWAYGLRNPWRFSFDRLTGNLYISDVGVTNQEVNFQTAGDPGGENYGWRWFDGTSPYKVPTGANTNGLSWPVAQYPALWGPGPIIGGYACRSPNYPRMDGMYFFGDNSLGNIWGLWNQAGLWYTNQLYSFTNGISAFGEDDAGNLYVATYSPGNIYQIQDPSVTYAPTFAPGGGTYNSTLTVTITSQVSGATIYFTTNGVNPTTNSLSISPGGTLSVNTSLTLKAQTFAPGMNPSPVATANYTLQVGTPVFSPDVSPIPPGTQISISSSTPGATIYYTLDGTTPGSNSMVYIGPITITTNVTLTAIGMEPNFVNSAAQSMGYATVYFDNVGITTVAGSGQAGYADGPAATASFNAPQAVWVDNANNVYVADTGNSRIRKISPSGMVTTLATNATFVSPRGVCVDSQADVFLTDTSTDNNRIYEISAAGVVTTFAGSGWGSSDGQGTGAQFLQLSQLDMDASGNIYAGDWGRVRKITPNAVVSTVAGTTGLIRLGGWSEDVGVGVDSFGNIFAVMDTYGTVWETTPSWCEGIYAGSVPGYADGFRTNALFQTPRDATVDILGNMFVSDANRIRKIRPDGTVITLCGFASAGSNDGAAYLATFNSPYGLAVDNQGGIYVADTGNNKIRKITYNNWPGSGCTQVVNINVGSAVCGEGSTSGGGTVPCGSNTTVCATPDTCNSFVNWTDQNSNVVSTSACYTFAPNTNVNLTANFTPISSYTIATSSSPLAGGTTSGGGTLPCSESSTTVCATANACYSFVNWTDQDSNVVSTSACYSFTAVSNETLVANFTPTSYQTITTTNVLTGAGTTSGGGTVACGSEVTVCATPNPCYNFSVWSLLGGGEVSTSACYTFTAMNSETLVANFEAGSTYRTIATGSSPSGGGTTSGGGTVTCGSQATVCASANSCYSFADWTLNGNVVSTSACYSFTATSNEIMVANFAVSGAPTSGSLTGLWSFTDGSDAANPYAGLIQGSDGNFYGTTYGSGSGPSANGTVFRISPGGNLSNLWSFTGGTDGANPGAGLMQGSDGGFYGTTYDGGAYGYGTVFRISSSGTLTSLWSFTGGKDGGNAYAGLIQGSDGNFYGTTYGSGSGPSANGTVFRISPSGNLSNLWSFTGGTDGANPGAGLVQGIDGNFYGTTYGSGSGPSAYGTVFRISPGGNLTKLWSFTNGLDGANSYATLVLGSDGNFYGTTSQGGVSGIGTVFRISPAGNLTNLWEFTGCVDGANPYTGLVQGSDGNFYGTTSGSGSGPSGYGNVFRITPSGSLTVLWSFTDGSDGGNPYAPLVQGMDGSFYGTTYQGGTNGNYGTVFRRSVSLNPPANQISGFQLMGTSLVVTIPSVAGETYQLQYSGSLTPSNWSNVGGVSMTNSIGGLLSLTNSGGGLQPQGFYRFAITP